MRLHDQLVAAQHFLIERDGSALHLFRSGDDVEQVVHIGRLAEGDVHVAHHEGEARRLGRRLLEQRAMVGADQAQVVGAAALHEAQIAGVIDDTGKIGVLVIDAHRLRVAAVADRAVEGVTIHLSNSASISLRPSSMRTIRILSRSTR